TRLVGARALHFEPPIRRTRDTFTATVNLDIGQNEITIEAIDTSGQSTQKVYTIRRNAVATASPPGSAPPKIDALRRRGEVYAVIIGIGDYQDDRIPDLDFTVNDAQGMYAVLTDPNYGRVPKDHVKLLLNEEATDRNIKREIGRWLRRQAQREDTVIIYYSGHGAPEFQETYWVTYNANIDDLYTTALNNNDIAQMLANIESERVITFLDSCYSAATVQRQTRTRSVVTEIPWDKFTGKGRVAISASDGKQLSLELPEYQHGVFTYYLLEGLRGNADRNRDGVVEVEEIWDYLKYQVTETAQKAGNPQTPVFQGSITAGIPITFNVPFLQEQQQEQQITAKLAQLKDFFIQGKIEASQYNCAYKMLKAGESDIWIDSLLAGELDPEVFRESFQCE
ncbi:hypothetical protein GF339_04900, partial [candidate division KSB3 bacterium]|nr:hypothetical protein [candidate division KSB3 bacterium]MBD3323899.1 hypothetical protein [candidate division KSB3 bacterium]